MEKLYKLKGDGLRVYASPFKNAEDEMFESRLNSEISFPAGFLFQNYLRKIFNYELPLCRSILISQFSSDA